LRQIFDRVILDITQPVGRGNVKIAGVKIAIVLQGKVNADAIRPFPGGVNWYIYRVSFERVVARLLIIR